MNSFDGISTPRLQTTGSMMNAATVPPRSSRSTRPAARSSSGGSTRWQWASRLGYLSRSPARLRGPSVFPW